MSRVQNLAVLRREPLSDTQHPKPFLKWAGGKRQLVPVLREHLPPAFKGYYEPFVGAGALLFELQPRQAVINDLNHDLITCYRVLKKNPQALIEKLREHRNEKDHFYETRALDRHPEFSQFCEIQRAARMIYLNKTCFNGLFRVNRKGHFNAPFGNYRNPNIVNEEGLMAVHRYISRSALQVFNTDFEEAVQTARRGDFIYFDPPYDPVSETASFTGYQSGGFGRLEQYRLMCVVTELTRRGCRVMLSNSATEYIRSLYKDFKIVRVAAHRMINSVGSRRGKIDEFLITNYDPETGALLGQKARRSYSNLIL
ncbi:DNA methyltransferase [bacterium (Candidatus Blackallbacteria) CG17_big_fil_post_rev_8_21_14_2_50_48_46]|uniref:Site-specific DNA-methyltransferase (adenine-specific) n=1 Tax=bacterium (Candidatus Blackallbacteria) CG17_big_fil_post_rev_8_21_14_2_50_48_46 TaxID=2014261 RepID=A0A2M7G0F4_9BACT|nr:MAG: DNA methyltransferase [bacterium (Candidatus Blackallbacteria) CG18_big_fil_WC_8_21_14_2_50_49_26]PIW15205.1 MAG: DNA methyltransferase [bacterium (Candidatus Blackallbacteria) CG17_big_fil_post_rev_8_21_14_2_50_48_46]PIW44792.1 MAG: DNA methyltransferase [bacterium (Candidatus Blackallbacteria) CG13_big_fil_rev_8_21_14_2_50_49_14]